VTGLTENRLQFHLGNNNWFWQRHPQDYISVLFIMASGQFLDQFEQEMVEQDAWQRGITNQQTQNSLPKFNCKQKLFPCLNS